MSTPSAEAAWAGLARHLEEVYTSWGVADPDVRARIIVRAMRQEGWRIPLPQDSRPPPVRGGGSDPEFRAKMVRDAREAVRTSRRTPRHSSL